MIQSEHTIRFTHGNSGKRQLRSDEQTPKAPGRVPRVTKLMALAIRLDQLIRDGVVADQAELARLLPVKDPLQTSSLFFATANTAICRA